MNGWRAGLGDLIVPPIPCVFLSIRYVYVHPFDKWFLSAGYVLDTLYGVEFSDEQPKAAPALLKNIVHRQREISVN